MSLTRSVPERRSAHSTSQCKPSASKQLDNLLPSDDVLNLMPKDALSEIYRREKNWIPCRLKLTAENEGGEPDRIDLATGPSGCRKTGRRQLNPQRDQGFVLSPTIYSAEYECDSVLPQGASTPRYKRSGSRSGSYNRLPSSNEQIDARMGGVELSGTARYRSKSYEPLSPQYNIASKTPEFELEYCSTSVSQSCDRGVCTMSRRSSSTTRDGDENIYLMSNFRHPRPGTTEASRAKFISSDSVTVCEKYVGQSECAVSTNGPSAASTRGRPMESPTPTPTPNHDGATRPARLSPSTLIAAGATQLVARLPVKYPNHDLIGSETRMSVVTWMKRSVLSLEWPLSVFFLAAETMDEFLWRSTDKGVNEEALPLLSTAGLLLGACLVGDTNQANKAKLFIGQVPNVTNASQLLGLMFELGTAQSKRYNSSNCNNNNNNNSGNNGGKNKDRRAEAGGSKGEEYNNEGASGFGSGFSLNRTPYDMMCLYLARMRRSCRWCILYATLLEADTLKDLIDTVMSACFYLYEQGGHVYVLPSHFTATLLMLVLLQYNEVLKTSTGAEAFCDDVFELNFWDDIQPHVVYLCPLINRWVKSCGNDNVMIAALRRDNLVGSVLVNLSPTQQWSSYLSYMSPPHAPSHCPTPSTAPSDTCFSPASTFMNPSFPPSPTECSPIIGPYSNQGRALHQNLLHPMHHLSNNHLQQQQQQQKLLLSSSGPHDDVYRGATQDGPYAPMGTASAMEHYTRCKAKRLKGMSSGINNNNNNNNSNHTHNNNNNGCVVSAVGARPCDGLCTVECCSNRLGHIVAPDSLAFD